MKDKLSENLLKDLYKTVVQNGPMDKRRHQRKDCLINVDISASNSCSNCYLLDINHNGAYIETDQSFSIDQLVSLDFVDPDYEQLITIRAVKTKEDV